MGKPYSIDLRDRVVAGDRQRPRITCLAQEASTRNGKVPASARDRPMSHHSIRTSQRESRSRSP